MTSSFYNCSLFNQEIKDLNNFEFTQEEILFNEMISGKPSFKKLNVLYKCFFAENDKADWSLPAAIIPIRNNTKLLKFTLDNLSKYEVYKYLNFIIVDDRSTDDIKSVCAEYPVSYLRVDNDKGFNFSSLNNIAAKIANDKGSKQIVLWNSDLWVPDSTTIPKLLEMHNKEDSTISGTKLLYPPFSWNGEEVSENISSVFPNKSKTYRGTVQFGGSLFIFNHNFGTYFPNHLARFQEPDYIKVNENRLTDFVTGAFQIIQLDWFISDGGLNPSVSKNFQDVDICLKAVEQDRKVMYFGKDIYLYHDESVSLAKEKSDKQFMSDHVLYTKLWDHNRFLKSIYKMG